MPNSSQISLISPNKASVSNRAQFRSAKLANWRDSSFHSQKVINVSLKARVNDLVMRFQEGNQIRLEKLERKIMAQKTNLNMVVHDLRNPVESIHQGLIIAKNTMQERTSDLIDDVIEQFEKLVDETQAQSRMLKRNQSVRSKMFLRLNQSQKSMSVKKIQQP